jgi:tetratricopeptide (TPR) repeat protein
MKKLFVLFMAIGLTSMVLAQDPAKDMKKAARLLGTYNLDPDASADKLQEAINLANASITDPTVAADPTAWQTYGEIFVAAINNDVKANVVDPKAPITQPSAPAKAYKGFAMAAELADKSYQVKDAMKALSAIIQNIYYMGSALYQAGNFQDAYEAFKATYDAYALLKKNNEPTSFSVDEQPKALYYSGLCAQQAGLNDKAMVVYQQLVNEGSAEAGVYEELFKMYQKDNPAEAEKILAMAREKYPEDTGLLYAEINYLLAKGELTGLISKLEKAIEMEPENISVYVTLGQIYDKLYQDKVATDPAGAEENFNKAMSYYQQALAKDPKSFDAVYSIGALWYNRAAAYSIELNNLSSDYSAAGNKKYEAKKAQMDESFVKALPFFLQAETLNARDANTLIALKEIYARQDKLDLVEQYKQKLDSLEKQ